MANTTRVTSFGALVTTQTTPAARVSSFGALVAYIAPPTELNVSVAEAVSVAEQVRVVGAPLGAHPAAEAVTVAEGVSATLQAPNQFSAVVADTVGVAEAASRAAAAVRLAVTVADTVGVAESVTRATIDLTLRVSKAESVTVAESITRTATTTKLLVSVAETVAAAEWRGTSLPVPINVPPLTLSVADTIAVTEYKRRSAVDFALTVYVGETVTTTERRLSTVVPVEWDEDPGDEPPPASIAADDYWVVGV